MRNRTRACGMVAGILLVFFSIASPLAAQTPAFSFDPGALQILSPPPPAGPAYVTKTNTWKAGSDELGADFLATLTSNRDNTGGYYQDCTYGVTGHVLGNSFTVLSGELMTSASQASGSTPNGIVFTTLSWPGGFSWTPFNNQALTASGQSSTQYYSLLPLFHAGGSYGWWAFSVNVSIDASLSANSSLIGCQMQLDWLGYLNGLAGTMRTGIGVTVTAKAGLSFNIIVASVGVTVSLYVTPVAGGIEMPYYLDSTQVSSDLNLVVYGEASVTITVNWSFLFYSDSHTWTPWTAKWDYVTLNLLRNGNGVLGWVAQPLSQRTVVDTGVDPSAISGRFSPNAPAIYAK